MSGADKDMVTEKKKQKTVKEESGKRGSISVGQKIYLFVGVTVFIAALTVAVAAHFINANRIDGYFKGLTMDTARNFVRLVDADFLLRLKEVAASDEYQELREYAEENDDEALIEDYLKKKGLWEDYVYNRTQLSEYLRNMHDVKYLYLIAWGGTDDYYDMYLIDDDEIPIYETGYYEEREEDFYGVDASVDIEPTISKGDWGWLCSAFAPVYTSDGTLVCQVGCDVAMDDIVRERRMNFLYILLAAVSATAVILAGVNLLISRIIIKPLSQITDEMKKFSPSEDLDYESSGVINLDIERQDEIGDIYTEIRSMQIRILDYLRDITIIRKEKEKAESDVQKKEMEIGEISKEAYRDPLTSVGNKIAYAKKVDEINEDIQNGDTDFAIVMVDVNYLKLINDKYGHSAGDTYIKGCCKVVCQVYKNSPVYRIGGDEFVVVLQGLDYRLRYEKLRDLRNAFEISYGMDDHDPWNRYSAASGMAEYASDDNTVELVFKRADKNMYDEKARFKEAHGSGSEKSSK